jgi:putative transposase
MGRSGHPYDNAKAESFMKTLKVEAVYPIAFETFADVTKAFRISLRRFTTDDGFTQRFAISALQFEDQRTRRTVKSAA